MGLIDKSLFAVAQWHGHAKKIVLQMLQFYCSTEKRKKANPVIYLKQNIGEF